MISKESDKLMEKAIQFHGHSCPGLAFGVVAAKFALNQWSKVSIDEEIVAIVENDNCSVDAIQALLGTTFGKGNLIFHDYGKNAYTFYNRGTKKAFRLSMKSNIGRDKTLDRDTLIQIIINSSPEDIFNIVPVEIDEPQTAKIFSSATCEICGELTMNTRLKQYNNKLLCIPCFNNQTKTKNDNNSDIQS